MILNSFLLNLLVLLDSLPLSCCQNSFTVWTLIHNNWSIAKPLRTQLNQYAESLLRHKIERPPIIDVTAT